MSRVAELFESVRYRCPPGLWSQGKKFASQGRVIGESQHSEEIVLRVRAPGLAVPPTVVLYPNDQEWDCDCPSQIEACAHVAAAIIGLREARERGDDLPKPDQQGFTVHYRITNLGNHLKLSRVLVNGENERELATTLYSAINRPQSTIDATHLDLEVDGALGPKPAEILSPAALREVFSLLTDIADRGRVTYGGRPVRVSAEEILPAAVLRDQGADMNLCVMINPEIDEVVADGVAIADGVLRPLGQTTVTGNRLEHLPIEITYPPGRHGELVTTVLPELEEQVVLDIRTRRLPGTIADIPPRIDLDVKQDGQCLSVMPMLVYGDPPQARIDNDRLVHLNSLVPIRDRSAEKQLVAALRDQLHLVPGRAVMFEGAEATGFMDKLRRWRGEVSTEKELLYKFPLIPRLLVDGEKFDLYFETATEEGLDRRRVSAEAVVGAWRGGLGQVPVDGGGWAPLPADWLATHGHRVADLLAAKQDDDELLPLFAVPTLTKLAEDMGQPKPASFDRLAPLVENFESLPIATLPNDLNADLREYQKRGVDWLFFLRDARLGAVLADDMGLGKTVQTICALRGRSLVVCPTSVLHNWSNEIKRFRPKLKTSIYHGAKRKLATKTDVVLTTYAILRIDAETLGKHEWNCVVLDEAQAIKNPSSQVARAAFGLNAEFRVALSGTPVENRLDELWSLLNFANKGLLGSRSDFQERYAKTIARGDDGVAERLRSRIRPFVLRRLKRDVAPELPPRTDSVLHVELGSEERSVYDAVRVATRKDLVERLSANGNVLAALEALLRLRQAACHPALIPGQKADCSSKVETLIDALMTATGSGHKALVFSQWTSFLDLIEPHLRDAGIEFLRLDGGSRNRGDLVKAFQADEGPPVLIASLKAGGTGLNLTAADHVFLTDPWWNPAAEDQAADRAHRIGQGRPVMVYRLVSRDTVEERILSLQEQKRGLADAALGQASQAISLTRDDLLALLE